VVILAALIASLGPLIVANLNDNTPVVEQDVNVHAALAAAEAGVEWYRYELLTNSSFYGVYAANNFSSSAGAASTNFPTSPSNAIYQAMSLGSWCSTSCDLSTNSPSEAFHVTPNETNLLSSSGQFAGEQLVIVTGRAGQSGNYDYVTVEEAFTDSAIWPETTFLECGAQDTATQSEPSCPPLL